MCLSILGMWLGHIPRLTPFTGAVQRRASSWENTILGGDSLPLEQAESDRLEVMTGTARQSELGEFLRARRSELSPRTVGLPEQGTRRRVVGLRREEVAQLASISTDYYTRLEQGRIQASAPVLQALVRVLHLSDDQRNYLLELAGKEGLRPRGR